MPITLFLDFDGVLNNDAFLRHQRNHVPVSRHRLFDPANIFALETLCRAVPIEQIVVTSSWKRNRDVPELQRLLAAEGFSLFSKVRDITPAIGDGALERAEEINTWIRDNRPARFLVLDDCDLSVALARSFYRISPATGLTSELVAKIASEVG